MCIKPRKNVPVVTTTARPWKSKSKFVCTPTIWRPPEAALEKINPVTVAWKSLRLG